jgi:hypothetical protein
MKLRSYFKIKPYVEFFARHMGYELVGEGSSLRNLSDFKLYPRKLPEQIGLHTSDPYTVPISVDISNITSRVGFSFSSKDWHPFVQTLKEYEMNPNLGYEDSTLAKLYKRYTPQNVQEVLTDQISTPQKPFCDWPPKYQFITWVWTLNQNRVDNIINYLKGRSDSDGWIYFGPHDISYGKKEFDRLISLYVSIKKEGFASTLSDKDPVNGYFLKKGNDVKFVLLQGNHRVSVLKALGHKSVNIIIRKGHPAVVDYDKLHLWTQGRGGIYSSLLIEQLFNNLFYGSGLDKAKRYGLNL